MKTLSINNAKHDSESLVALLPEQLLIVSGGNIPPNPGGNAHGSSSPFAGPAGIVPQIFGSSAE